jgi:hypothetical protein
VPFQVLLISKLAEIKNLPDFPSPRRRASTNYIRLICLANFGIRGIWQNLAQRDKTGHLGLPHHHCGCRVEYLTVVL